MVCSYRSAYLWISIFLILGFAASAFSQENSDEQTPANINLVGEERFEVGEELIMSLQVDNWRLAQLFVENSKYGVKVSWTELIQALDFPIQSTDSLQYEGWFISEDRLFTLTNSDADNNLYVTVADKAYTLTPDYYSIQHNELYIELQEIAKWFQLNPSVDYTEQVIVLDPSEELPIQQKTKSQNKKIYTGSRSAESTAPFLDRGHTVYTAQALDFQANINTNERNTSGSYTLLGAREVLQHNVKLYVNGNDQDFINSARFTLSKYSPEGWSLVGPLNLTGYSLGDITPTRVGSLGTNQISRGMSFSNTKVGNLINNEFTNIAGDVLPGWDVELYRGSVLIEQRFDVANGRYEFNDVPLLIGENTFELVFYGPQGQIKREIVNRSLTKEKLNTQNFAYSLSITEVGKTLLKNNLPSQTNSNQGFNLSGEYSFKIGDNSRVKLGHENIIGGNAETNTIALGFNTQIADSILLNADASVNDFNDYVLGLNARTKIFDQSIRVNLNSRRIENQENQEKVTTNALSLLATGQILKANNFGLRHQTEFNLTNKPTQDIYQLSSNLGVNIGKAYFYSGADYRYETSNQEEFISGNLGYQQNFNSVFAKVQLGFQNDEINDNLKFSNIFSSLTWLVSPSIRTRLEYSKSLIDDNNRMDLSVDWKKDKFSLSADISNSSFFGWEFGVYARLNFSGTPEYGSYLSSNRSLINTGTLLVRVFVDENANYTYDIGEQLLPNVKVRSKQSTAVGTTNENGIGTLLSLYAHKKTDIMIDRSSLEDPFLTPYLEAISVRPRPGFIDQIDFPVAISGELDGTVYTQPRDTDKTSLGANIKLGLYDQTNRLVGTTRTEFDGFYLLTNILPGKYHLNILPESLQKYSLEPIQSETIVISPQGDVINGFDITATKKSIETVFLVNHGEFPNKKSLNIYWQLNKKKMLIMTNNRPISYLFDNKSGNYSFVLYKSTNRNSAYGYCDKFANLNISCEITEKIEIN